MRRLGGRTALVVDDSAATRKQVGRALHALGLRTREAEDGAEAWRSLQESAVDLIVTDVNMPVMDGLKLISLVRGDEVHRATPIVVITAEAGEEEARRAEGLGASAWLPKPVEDAAVIRVVRALIAERGRAPR